MDDKVREYTVSIGYDSRLYRQDISGSVAHARMLSRQGILSDKELELIVMGLFSIREEIENNTFPWDPALEDIHMNVESRLREKSGADLAGKLHTGRSRNDQICLDMRMYVKESIRSTIDAIIDVQSALLDVAEANEDVLMPGYTHMQRAQPVLIAHHMLAYFHMLKRDSLRFSDCLRRTDVLPLGSGALAGVPYADDREFLAKELGFSTVSPNSMDAVADRDFLAEYQSCAAICMMHLSRLAEELIIWSSQEFSFIKLDSSFVTGSSMMPQKRNPDYAELARGKTGRVYGNLIGILTVLKGLPLTYNRDLQEDKESTFDTVDTILATLQVMSGMLSTMEIDIQRLSENVADDYLLATDVADYLVKRQIPFREAHSTVSRLCEYARSVGKLLNQLPLEDFKKFSQVFDETIYDITPQSSVAARDVRGGTAPNQVKKSLIEARKLLQCSRGTIEAKG